MMIKTRTWVIAIAALAAVLLLLSLHFLGRHREGAVAQIVQDGTVIREIDLSQVKEEFRFVLPSPHGGSNTVLVQPGRICIEEADCPDQICVMQGWLSDQAMPLVCLPHGLIITIKASTDGTADVSTR